MDLHTIVCGSTRHEDKRAFEEARYASLAELHSQLASYPDIRATLLKYLSQEHLAITWAAQALPDEEAVLHRRMAMTAEQRAIQRLVAAVSSAPVSPHARDRAASSAT